MLPAGKTLADVVSKPTLAVVQTALAAIAKTHPQLANHPGAGKLLYTQFATLRPWMAALQIAMLEMTLKYAGRPPLDQVLCETAVARGKPLYGLETAQEQLGAMTALTAAEQEAFLHAVCQGILDDKSEKTDPLASLLNAYLRGDMAGLAAEFARAREQAKKFMSAALYDKIMTGLLAERNVRMTKAVAARLTATPQRTGFFAVGAGHMIGKTGLVEALRKTGYTVTRIKAAVAPTITPARKPTIRPATKPAKAA